MALYAIMPDRLLAHEKRERWSTAISASFRPITVFRFARKRALEANDLLVLVEEEIEEMKRLAKYIPLKRLQSFWRGVCHTLRALHEGYFDILTRIADLQWTWWRYKDEELRNHFRIRAHSMIKHLAVYDWLLSLLQNAFTSSFEDYRPWFLAPFEDTQRFAVPQRRASFSGFTRKMTDAVYEKTVTELSILRWTRLLEEQLQTSISEMQQQYDQGKVFEHYVSNLQWTGEQEKHEWKQERLRWPYPDHLLKLKGVNDKTSKLFKRHSPPGDVPVWKDDEELQKFLPYSPIPPRIRM